MGSVNILLQFESKDLIISLTRNMYDLLDEYWDIEWYIIDILHSLIFMSAPTSFKDNWRSGRDWKGDTHGREGYLQASRWYLWKHWSVELPKTCEVFWWRLEIPECFFGQKLKLMRFHCLMSCVWFSLKLVEGAQVLQLQDILLINSGKLKKQLSNAAIITF